MRSTIHAEERVNKQDTKRWGVTLHSYINFIGVRLIPFSILHVIHSPVDSAVYTLFFPFVLCSNFSYSAFVSDCWCFSSICSLLNNYLTLRLQLVRSL